MLLMIILDQVKEEIEWSPNDSLIIVGLSEGILYVVDDNFGSSYRGNRMESRLQSDHCWCVRGYPVCY